MNMVIPNEGKLKWLDDLFDGGAREDFAVDLFNQNEVVDDASTWADFSVATFTGYAQYLLFRAGFNAAIITADIGVSLSTATPTFTCTGGAPETVYGWVMRGAVSGIIYAGQNFDTARVMSNGIVETLDPFAIRLKTLD